VVRISEVVDVVEGGIFGHKFLFTLTFGMWWEMAGPFMSV